MPCVAMPAATFRWPSWEVAAPTTRGSVRRRVSTAWAAATSAVSCAGAAVPAASIGSSASLFMLIGGVIFQFQPLILLGIIAFAAVVFFQVVNLPVEFDASHRAKTLLVERGEVPDAEVVPVAGND